jgi:opacity protein-like surface antigen
VKRILIAAVIAISAMAVISRTTLALSAGLGDTSWSATQSECNLGIDFNSDGTAFVGDMDRSDTAHWKLDGNSLHIKFDTLYGGVEGTYDGNRIEATETWQDKSTQVVHNDPCTLEKAK